MKPNYPIRLLPSDHHKIIDLNEFFDDYHVVNYCKEDKPYTDLDEMKDGIDDQLEAKRFKSGCSVTLSVNFNKGELEKKIIKNEERKYFDDWKPGMKAIMPLRQHIDNIADRGYFGISINDIKSVFSTIDIKAEDAPLRKDRIYFKVIHRPTLTNYWHCHIEVFGTMQGANIEYQASDKKRSNFSNKKIEQAAQQLARLLKPYLIEKTDINYKFIPYNKYLSSPYSKIEYKRFKKV